MFFFWLSALLLGRVFFIHPETAWGDRGREGGRERERGREGEREADIEKEKRERERTERERGGGGGLERVFLPFPLFHFFFLPFLEGFFRLFFMGENLSRSGFDFVDFSVLFLEQSGFRSESGHPVGRFLRKRKKSDSISFFFPFTFFHLALSFCFPALSLPPPPPLPPSPLSRAPFPLNSLSPCPISPDSRWRGRPSLLAPPLQRGGRGPRLSPPSPPPLATTRRRRAAAPPSLRCR